MSHVLPTFSRLRDYTFAFTLLVLPVTVYTPLVIHGCRAVHWLHVLPRCGYRLPRSCGYGYGSAVPAFYGCATLHTLPHTPFCVRLPLRLLRLLGYSSACRLVHIPVPAPQFYRWLHTLLLPVPFYRRLVRLYTRGCYTHGYAAHGCTHGSNGLCYGSVTRPTRVLRFTAPAVTGCLLVYARTRGCTHVWLPHTWFTGYPGSGLLHTFVCSPPLPHRCVTVLRSPAFVLACPHCGSHTHALRTLRAHRRYAVLPSHTRVTHPRIPFTFTTPFTVTRSCCCYLRFRVRSVRVCLRIHCYRLVGSMRFMVVPGSLRIHAFTVTFIFFLPHRVIYTRSARGSATAHCVYRLRFAVYGSRTVGLVRLVGCTVLPFTVGYRVACVYTTVAHSLSPRLRLPLVPARLVRSHRYHCRLLPVPVLVTVTLLR